MAAVFDYAVIVAIPDVGRGERVNLGIIVFLPDRLDIRLAEFAKLRALTGRDWQDHCRLLCHKIIDRFEAGEFTKDFCRSFPQIDRVFRFSSVASFSIKDEALYEERIKELMAGLVLRPKADEERVRNTRINTEITRQLRRARVLALGDDAPETHKVFRNVPVEDGLKADFWQKNGAMRFTSTVDFRRSVIDIKEAALKSLVLDQAEKKFENAKRYGVFAARAIDEKAAQPFIHLLTGYADDTFNWESGADQRRYMDLTLAALGREGALV